MIAQWHQPWLAGERPVWAIRSRALVTPEGIQEGAVLIEDDRIMDFVPAMHLPPGCPIFDVGDRAVLPGLVDLHVHINEPGRTDWEGFASATRAAAAGGITTLVDMPLNSSPVTTTVAALKQKAVAAQGKLWVDLGFHGGVVPGNADQLAALGRGGVLGFKAFLCPSGIDEFPPVTEADLRAVLPILNRLEKPLLVHAELVSALPEAVRDRLTANSRSYAAYRASRPPEWEHQAIRLLIGLCREYHCRIHIVHLSSADALPMVAQAKDAGLPLTVETCPHYLCFAAEEVPDGDPRFKCAPPLRDRDNRERLWEALGSGLIDTIASDHSPAPPALKELATGNLQTAWGGIASLQVALPVVWTEARRRGFTLADVVRWMAEGPADVLWIDRDRGSLSLLASADLVVFDPETSWTVEGARLQHRHPLTPYEGREVVGRVDYTFVRGRLMFEHGHLAAHPEGRIFWTTIMVNLDRLHAQSEAEAHAAFLWCCGSTRWAEQMTARRPFRDEDDLFQAAEAIWQGLDRADWLEAFAAHPKIGDLEALRTKFGATDAGPASEQAGVAGSSESVLHSLAQGNAAYEAKFGYMFIVNASGKTGAELLALLQHRLGNDPEQELRIAGAEQLQITRSRLETLT